MSKAAVNSRPGSIKRVLYANSTTLAVIMCVLCVGPYLSANLSVIASVKVVVEVVCCYLLVVNLILTVSLRDVELPPYRTQRSTSLKVSCAEIRRTVLRQYVECMVLAKHSAANDTHTVHAAER